MKKIKVKRIIKRNFLLLLKEVHHQDKIIISLTENVFYFKLINLLYLYLHENTFN
jgi:hypothetical protein